MKKGGMNKRVIILYVLNILKLYSTEDTPVTQSAICNYLNDVGISCDRKTVGRNIKYLIKFGYPIERRGIKGYYLSSRVLESKNRFAI